MRSSRTWSRGVTDPGEPRRARGADLEVVHAAPARRYPGTSGTMRYGRS